METVPGIIFLVVIYSYLALQVNYTKIFNIVCLEYQSNRRLFTGITGINISG
jgi:hypothetical protein